MNKFALPDGPAWDELRRQLEAQLEDEITLLEVSFAGRRLILAGEVASEATKQRIEAMIVERIPASVLANRLVVASPFFNAGDDGFDVPMSPSEVGAAPDNGGEVPALEVPPTAVPDGIGDGRELVTRFPTAQAISDVRVGERLDLKVDLSLTPPAGAEDSGIDFTADGDWTTLPIDVEIVSWQLQVDDVDRRAVILVKRDAPSRPVMFSALVAEEARALGRVNIHLIFSHDGRPCGELAVSFELTASQSAAAMGETTTTSVNIPTDQPSADLTVNILQDPGGGDRYQWTFNVGPGLRNLGEAFRFASSGFGMSAKDYFKAKFNACPYLVQGQHQGALQGIGEEIWRAAPLEFRNLYLAIQKSVGFKFSIQIMTNEPYVPWELMFPVEEDLEGAGHLYLMHPTARWFMDGASMPASFPTGDVITFTPQYEYGDNLPAAQAEAEWLVTKYGAHRPDPTYAGFMGVLQTPPSTAVRLLHFAGHGASEGAPGSVGIRMFDGWVPVDAINSSVQLGKRYRPICIINACQVGATDACLASTSGWPPALVRRSFSGVIAPLWSVQDNIASEFIKDALTELIDNQQSFGNAVLKSRQNHSAVSPSAFAYLSYGDVMAKAAN